MNDWGMNMNKLLIALMLFSANSFASYDVDRIDQMEQQNKQIEIERRIDNMEQEKRFNDAMNQLDDITTKGYQ